MKKTATISAICIMFMLLAFVPLNAQGWQIYDGGVLPTATGSGGDSLDISTVKDESPGAGLIAEIVDDPDIVGNKIFKYLHPDGKTTYVYNFDDIYADSNFTIVARIKGDTAAVYDRAFDIRWDNKNAGTRDELRIWMADSVLELEKADLKVNSGVKLTEWHTYRIAVSGDLSTVYVDEDPTPVVSGVTTATTTNAYMKLGDGSGDAIGGYLDWFVLDTSGAFAPGEGLPIPAELYVDGGPVMPEWLVYDGSILPTATADGPGLLNLSDVSDSSPGAGIVAEIIDDTDIIGNKIFKYLHPDGKTTYRHFFDDAYTDSNFTLMARIKGEDDTAYDRAFDIRWDNKNAGTRDELRIWTHRDTLELEKADLEASLGGSATEWHTYRIAVSGDLATVYIDENLVPVVSGVTLATTTSQYLKIGDGSGDAIGGYMDWCALDVSGAYAPGEGAEIPSYLYVDGGPEPAKWQVYRGDILPEETTGGGDSLDISEVKDTAPGANLTVEIIDDLGVPGNKLLKYLQPDEGGKTTYRHTFDSGYTDSIFTIMARVKGDTAAVYSRAFDIRWDNGNAGTRDELRIWPVDSTLELEKVDASIQLDVNFYEWHTFRIVVNGDYTEVFLDEAETPVISGTSVTSSTEQSFRMGDGSSGDEIGGYMDWCMLDTSGAYPASKGIPIPTDLIVDFGPEPYIPKWLVYDAGVLPSATADCGGDTLDISEISQGSPGTGFVEEIIDDPDNIGNKLLKYLQPEAAATTMYRHNLDAEDAGPSFTLMARVKGEAAFDRPFDLQWRNANANARDELRIWPADSTLELEKANVTVKVEMDLYAWHTYRIAVYGDSAVIFVDEYSEPFLTGVSTEASSDLYIKIGDGSSDAVGGYLDWCILDISGAFSPGEGLAIPLDLIIDKYTMPVEPGWLVYDGSLLPTETLSGNDSLDISSLSEDSPGPDMVELIVDDPDIAGNRLFQCEQPTSAYKRMYRSFFNEYWSGTEFTLIARTKGLVGYDQNFTFQWRFANASAREDIRLYSGEGRIKLEKANIEVFPEFSLTDWHTIRIAVYGDSTAIFVDEVPTPIITGKTPEGTSESYFKIGDRGDGTLGGLLDWMILDISGAYAPGEGVPIPEGLYVDVPNAVDDQMSALPKKFRLAQNYPNPFNPTTTINYELPKSSKVTIRLFDMLGKEVMTIVNKEQAAGYYSLNIESTRLASGIYFYHMIAGDFVQTKKMMLLK